MSRTNRSVKVLDFVQLGGPDWTKSRTEADSRTLLESALEAEDISLVSRACESAAYWPSERSGLVCASLGYVDTLY